MKSDIEIAQEAELYPVTEVAKALDMTIDDLELYGKYKAKISEEYLKKIENNKDGRLILVTAINPTPAGRARPPRASVWVRRLAGWESGLSSRCGSLRLVRALASRAVRQAAEWHRLCQWRT